MKTFIQKQLVPAFLAIIAFFTLLPFIETTTRIYNKSQRAIDWHSVNVVNKAVKPGEVLEIEYSLTVNKQCPSDLRGFIISSDDNYVPVRYPPVAGGYVKPTQHPIETRVKITIPTKADNGLAPFKTGSYVYRAVATRYCPEGIEEDTDIPDAPFYLDVPEK